jgi:hypothetical protein
MTDIIRNEAALAIARKRRDRALRMTLKTKRGAANDAPRHLYSRGREIENQPDRRFSITSGAIRAIHGKPSNHEDFPPWTTAITSPLT